METTTSSNLYEKPPVPHRGFAADLPRAFLSPGRAWKFLRRWTLLALYTHLPLGGLLRYRRELREDTEFQSHLEHCLRDVHYVFPEAAELYAVIRAAKPRVVVETGVASGRSSAHILRALDRNGAGRLHSIDLPNVQDGSVLPEGRTSGWIVPDSLRSRWDLQIRDSRELLPSLLWTLNHVDLFLHDSDHSYEAMTWEFEQVYPKMAYEGFIMSDDTHLHGAWDDFCEKHGLRPTRIGHLGVTRNK